MSKMRHADQILTVHIIATKGDLTGTPKVAGYSFVSSTPTPSMSQMGDDPDMMTWGTIEDEPLLISSGIGDSGMYLTALAITIL